MSYSKLDSGIIFSSIWGESSDIRIVWVTMLALKDQDGVVHSSVPGLARAACVPIETVEQALEKFSSSDPYSRTPYNDGIRIEKVQGGWKLLNHVLYRDKNYSSNPDAVRMREKRKHKHANNDEHNRTCSESDEHAVSVSVSDSVSESSSESKKEKKEYLDTDEEMIIAKKIYEYIKSQGTAMKEPNFQSWASEVAKFGRIDGLGMDRVGEIVEAVFKDPFWSNVIRSPSKLRAQLNSGKLDKVLYGKRDPNEGGLEKFLRGEYE